ncbi:hypothetical protein [Calidifontibacter terrae]
MLDVAATIARTAISWLVIDGRAWPVWHAVDGDRLFVVSGPDEQPLPHVPETVELILRTKDTHSRRGPYPARASRIRPGVTAWDPAVAALLAARQGAPGEAVVDHWKATCAVWAIDVDPNADEPVATRQDPSYAAPPLPTPATTKPRLPRHLGRLRRR